MLLLDTNIISYLLKQDSRATLYQAILSSDKAHAISLMTVAELFQWADERNGVSLAAKCLKLGLIKIIKFCRLSMPSVKPGLKFG